MRIVSGNHSWIPKQGTKAGNQLGNGNQIKSGNQRPRTEYKNQSHGYGICFCTLASSNQPPHGAVRRPPDPYHVSEGRPRGGRFDTIDGDRRAGGSERRQPNRSSSAVTSTTAVKADTSVTAVKTDISVTAVRPNLGRVRIACDRSHQLLTLSPWLHHAALHTAKQWRHHHPKGGGLCECVYCVCLEQLVPRTAPSFK